MQLTSIATASKEYPATLTQIGSHAINILAVDLYFNNRIYWQRAGCGVSRGARLGIAIDVNFLSDHRQDGRWRNSMNFTTSDIKCNNIHISWIAIAICIYYRLA